ncbi:hypothetical protein [Acanthopleuribacter pedis]|uniref:SMP-30/Gluconolactonase/LRE-like region domain-containing protein n=1 Tax=Acanthopleuribacter pedis TaxID=442870 RepID=A0A8J7U3Q5_9BACT|nr:hypothetical protein [Acanthopleuribacter pedis]MBO1317276.1 hypothetical protein [Acanthopleuribacter pedis]MBO1318583.1 hypothetical protein [Acanthopleuribacter pedis]
MKYFTPALFVFFATALSAETRLIVPWVTNNDSFQATLIINNLGNTQAEIRLHAIRPSGQTPDMETRTLQIDALAQHTAASADLFPELGTGSGYMVLLESARDSVSAGLVVTATGSASGSSPAQADVLDPEQTAKTILFNFLTAGAANNPSAPVIVNPGAVEAQVTFFAYQNGSQAGTATRTIAANRPFAETATSLFPELSGALYLVAQSDQPILGMAFIFNELLEPAMAAATPIPALPGATEPVRPYVDTFVAMGVGMDGFIIDEAGNLYGAGGWLNDNVIRIAPSGEVTTLATGLRGPVHMARDSSGKLYVSNFNDTSIRTIDETGQVTLFARGLDAPVGMAFDADGNLFVCNYGGSAPGRTISKITPAGVVSVFANDPLLHTPIDVFTNADGSLYVANQIGGAILHVDVNGTVSLIGQIPGNLGHMAVVGDSFYATGDTFIYKMTRAGRVTLFSGQGVEGDADGALSEATFRRPNGIALGPDGRTLFIGSATRGQPSGSVRRIHLE